MAAESEKTLENLAEPEEKQLCLNCLFPNEVRVHFCGKCGAPLTSYAATGPFEHLFAEGHMYRQAAERPRSAVVVFGVWLLFGNMAVVAVTLFIYSRDLGALNAVFCGFLLFVAIAMIWKTTRNYARRPRGAAEMSNEE